MGVMKTLDIELQDLDIDVDFRNRDDVFDLVVDCKLAGQKLSSLMLQFIVSRLDDPRLVSLWLNGEFCEALEWQYV